MIEAKESMSTKEMEDEDTPRTRVDTNVSITYDTSHHGTEWGGEWSFIKMSNENAARKIQGGSEETEFLSLLSTYVPIRVANLLSDESSLQSKDKNPIDSRPVEDSFRTCAIVVDFKCLLSRIYQAIRKKQLKFPTEQHRQAEPSKILGEICNKIAVTCHELGGDIVKFGPHEIVVMWPDTKVQLADRVASAVTASLKISTELSKNLKIVLVRLVGNVEEDIAVGLGMGTFYV